MNKIQIQNQELIQISETEINGVKVQTVNARDLHAFLESKQDFSTWIKNRIAKYDFIENQDFKLIHKKMEQVSGVSTLNIALRGFVRLQHMSIKIQKVLIMQNYI